MVAALVGSTPSQWHAQSLPLGFTKSTFPANFRHENNETALLSGGGGGGSEATVRAVEGSAAGSVAGSVAGSQAARVDVARAGRR